MIPFERFTKCLYVAVVIGLNFITTQRLDGAVYYVSISGNDSNPGSSSLPWRTVQKAANGMVAGDTALIGPGNYAEYVVTRAHGNNGARIRFLANASGGDRVVVRQFRVRHRHNTIEGFDLTGAQDLNMASIRIEYNPPIDGSHTVITNNTFRDGVYLISDDLRFNARSNSITTLKANWLSRGFEPGAYIFLGSNSKNPYRNHDTHWRVKAVTANTIYLTNSARATFLDEPAPAVWGVIYAGNGNNACPAVDFVLGAGVTASTNCIIAGNTFSNLFGCPIKLNGDRHLVEGNVVTRIHGYYGIQPQGRNHVIRRNLFVDCTNFLFFTQYEMGNIPHPEGGNYFDYQVAFVSSFVNESTNIVFEQNWIQNAHNQMGLISHAPGSYGYIIRSNVFVGVQTHLSGSRSGLTFANNTFYRCSFDEGRALVLGLGGVSGNVQKDLVIRRNLFVDCGSHSSFDNEGYYGITDSLNPVVDENFVCGPETIGFAPKRFFDEPNGLNGGDPIFANTENPLGPDGKPFTLDDGLKPLPNSPISTRGWGALSPRTVLPEQPVSHFRVASPLRWSDAVGTNFNPAWVQLEPYNRGDVVRPYHTPEALGHQPVSTTFSAMSSIDGTGVSPLDNREIVSYQWSFGDGTSVITTNPVVAHTFTFPGAFPVSLTVSNRAGQVATLERRYRVLPSTTGRLAFPTGLRIVQ